MADLTAQRTLVKSPPELWSELSEVESLARHLGELGEIRIVKVEPESTVAWEGEQVSGTVELEQSGWGTKVTFKATVPEPDEAAEPVAQAPAAPEVEPVTVEAEPVAVGPEPVADEPVAVEPEPVAAEAEPVTIAAEEPRQGFFARWLFRRRQPLPETEPTPIQPSPDIAPAAPVEPLPAAAAPDPDPAPDPEPDPDPEPEPIAATAADRVQRVLDGTLEALGQAHHRPFSRG